ncbi:hypothetical protein ACIGNX_30450 [Actinosynnema sp. NPDC053489]|uniref:hypothetical protein n=1 Tax=Actinosynnema sp. NPDC053489 TaxID=3363916 RepID=UPI0037CB1897
MVFDNVFGFADRGAGLFSVNRDDARPRAGEGVDFEDADDDTYDDVHPSLFTSGIHGGSARARVVSEQSPEARAVLGFLGAFLDTARTASDAQSRYAADPGSVSQAASAGMRESSTTVTGHGDLQKDSDLASRPGKDDFASAPEAPEPTAETPSRVSGPSR